MILIKMMNEEERMVARQSQELGPRIGEMGWSERFGLKLRVLMIFLLRVDSFIGFFSSRVTKALIWISTHEEMSVVLRDAGRIRLSMERSEESLNAQIRVILGTLHLCIEFT